MSTRYRCPECKVILTRFEVVEEVESVPFGFWGARGAHRSAYLACGHCGADVEEIEEDDSEEESNA